MKLSDRLEMIASFVEPGNRLADIGTDHGYIPIYLVQTGCVPYALARDVRRGPLQRAKEHIGEAGLSGKIQTRLSDGLKKLAPGEADTVVIAGMGGELEIHILEEGRHVWDSVSQWVLSPQSDLAHVRHYLLEHGFSIRREEMVKEEGKFYTILDAAGPGREGKSGGTPPKEPEQPVPRMYERESDYLYGKCLIESGHPVLEEFLKQERETVRRILESLSGQDTESAAKRTEELKKKLNLIEEAQNEVRRNHRDTEQAGS